MNYLIACDDFFPDQPTGASRVAWDLALAMRDRGHRVCSVCRNQKAGRLPDGMDKVEGTEVLRYTPSPSHRLDPRRLKRSIAAAAQVTRQHLKARDWDVLHMHSPATGRGVADALPEVRRRVYTMHSPVVLEQQINWSQQGWMGRIKQAVGYGPLKRLEGGLLRDSQHIHALSEFTRQQIENFYGLGARVTVIPHWCRSEFKRTVSRDEARHALGWPADLPIFFTLRRHVYRMGLDVAIEAVAPLAKARRCRLMIGGDGPLRSQLEQQASGLGCAADQIQFRGRLSDADLALAYQAADLFLLPTRALECFGLIVLEAMACGCPVLGTDVGAIPELLQPITPELIVPANRADLMRQKLEQFLSGQLKLPESNRIADHVATRYDRSAVLQQHFQLLEL